MVIWSYKMSFPDYLAADLVSIGNYPHAVHVLLFKKHKTSIY